MPTRRRIVSRQVEPSEWDAVAVIGFLAVCAAGTLVMLVWLTWTVLAVAAYWCQMAHCCAC